MTSVTTGFASGSGNGNGGTMFVAMLSPQGDALKEYDNTKSHSKQRIPLPQTLHDIMSVRENVYGDQGVPVSAEFDEDDARSWHWVNYASVAATSSPSPPSIRPTGLSQREEDERRSSATAQSVGVSTVRLVPPPHHPSTYNPNLQLPAEPYIKLGRLAVRQEFRDMGLSRLVVDAALKWAAKNPNSILPPPPPMTMEAANQLGTAGQDIDGWKGVTLVHSQLKTKKLWAGLGFTEELHDEQGGVQIPAQDHWDEEGIEHLAMWKRVKVDPGRL